MNEIHVVTGAGPVGSAVASQLADHGHTVRLLTRSGSGPGHALIERRRVDVARPGALDEHFSGATAVFHCIHASRYDAATWRAELPTAEQAVLAAAGRAGAVVVFPESLYAYGEAPGPITEDTPRNAAGGKPGVRTELLRAREESGTPTVSVVASDFYGPRVLTSHAGERMVPAVLRGRTIRVMGSADVPHSFTYVPDLATAMVRAAALPETWNSVLHAPTAPAVTQRELITALADAADVPAPKVGTLPHAVLRAVGLVHRGTRELVEMSYQFRAPFVMDSSRTERALGLSPTPLDVAAKTTVDWWRARLVD